jgi:hypothetical protein
MSSLFVHVRALAPVRTILATLALAAAVRAIFAAIARTAGAFLAGRRDGRAGVSVTSHAGRHHSRGKQQTTKQFNEHEILTFLKSMRALSAMLNTIQNANSRESGVRIK